MGYGIVISSPQIKLETVYRGQRSLGPQADWTCATGMGNYTCFGLVK